MMHIHIAVLLALLANVSGRCLDIPNDRPEGCYDEPNMARITCHLNEPCECVPSSGKCPDITYDNLTAKEIDAERCKAICESLTQDNDTTNNCEYFRWEKV